MSDRRHIRLPFGVATYTRVGAIRMVKVFGRVVYRQIGSLRRFTLFAAS